MLYSEIVGWKYISHPNVLPFLGVSESLFWFSIISPWLPNGNIVQYTKKDPLVNRLQLVSNRRVNKGEPPDLVPDSLDKPPVDSNIYIHGALCMVTLLR